MKVFQLILLLLLAASYRVEARGRVLRKGSNKKGKNKGKGGGGGGGGSGGGGGGTGGGGGGVEDRFDAVGDVIDVGNISPYGIDEPSDCLVFDSNLVQATIAKYDEDHDEICNSNGCGSFNSPGCCRFHTNLLRCDEDNDYAHQPVSTRSTID